ncbi:caspase-1-like isoform X2 [Osmia bicornis bicornis]|uniref:caspase-1-like isoform X2 n=1 Tax=Osmia bicornis bicornis TaxID=1437191 RepID=UPI001EAF4FD6|nr:caspase-1-like isoform X2 [Osmia bicornis bicornis]
MRKSSVSGPEKPGTSNEKQTGKEENQSAAGTSKSNPESKPAASKTENKPAANKTGNKAAVNRPAKKLSVSKIAIKIVPNKTESARKLTVRQAEQNGKQTVTKKEQPGSSERNTATKTQSTVKKNLLFQQTRDIETGKQSLRTETEREVHITKGIFEREIERKIQHIVDAWSFNKRKLSPPKRSITRTVRSRVQADDEEYNMNHARTGVALIFNHVYFRKMQVRTGSEKDKDSISEALKQLQFDVRCYDDLSSEDVLQVLKEVAAEDHTDADCLVVVVLSHGSSGYIHTFDTMYKVESLWTRFIAERCPTLAGKPKLFFIQACRGNKGDNPTNIDVTDGTSATPYTIPSHADIMIAYSTNDGFFSFRNVENGSWFIQALSEELTQNWRTRDLMRIMTSVTRRVAIDYISNVYDDETKDKKKQVPSVVTMLTRLVYFSDKSLQ